MLSILVADDNQATLHLLQRATGLSKVASQAKWQFVSSVSELLAVVQSEPVDLVLTDVIMEETVTSDVIDKIRKSIGGASASIIAHSGHHPSCVEGLDNFDGFVQKSPEIVKLISYCMQTAASAPIS